MKEFIHKNPLIQGKNCHSSLNNAFPLPINLYQFKRGNDSHYATVNSILYSFNFTTVINQDDSGMLFEDVIEHVEKLPACNNKASNQKIAGKQLPSEAKNTLDEYCHTRRHWQTLFYHEIHQIVFNTRDKVMPLSCLLDIA